MAAPAAWLWRPPLPLERSRAAAAFAFPMLLVASWPFECGHAGATTGRGGDAGSAEAAAAAKWERAFRAEALVLRRDRSSAIVFFLWLFL